MTTQTQQGKCPDCQGTGNGNIHAVDMLDMFECYTCEGSGMMTNYQIYRLMCNPTTVWLNKDEWIIVQVDHGYSTEDFSEVAAWNITDALPVEGAEPYELDWEVLSTHSHYVEFDGMDSYHLVKRTDLEIVGLD